MKKIAAIAALVLLLAGCNGKIEMDPQLLTTDQVSLMVKGKMIFTLEDGQLAYNRKLGQFRAGNDDMSRFFILTCRTSVLQEGQEVTADIQWTSGNTVKTQKGLVFKVEKYESTGLVRLWSAADKTGATVKVLD
jgi:hypothetical protein